MENDYPSFPYRLNFFSRCAAIAYGLRCFTGESLSCQAEKYDNGTIQKLPLAFIDTCLMAFVSKVWERPEISFQIIRASAKHQSRVGQLEVTRKALMSANLF